MRKTVLLLMTLCLSVAAQADFVTVDQAKAKAAAFFTEHSKSKKQIQASSLKLSNPSARKSPSLTTSSKPCYYIFNTPDSTGFVIVSAESSTVEILAYSDEGYFHTDDIDKGAEVFLNQYTRDIEQVRTEGLTAEQKAYVRKANEASSDGEVLLKTANLNQGDGYWNEKYCPLMNEQTGVCSPAGCVATAAAIIMHYHKWPAQGKGSNSYVSATNKLSLSRDFSQDTYDWNCIPYEAYSNCNEDPAWTDKAKDEIGKILLACGISCGMDYNYTGSSASEDNMLNAMIKNFSYAVDHKYSTDNGLWDTARNSIDNDMPVMVFGNGNSGAHAFVIDGYNSSYYHYNMGWGGSNNGWYANGSIGNLNYFVIGIYANIHPQTGRTLASGEACEGVNYNFDDAGILNISGTGIIPDMDSFIPKVSIYANYPIINVTECNIAEGITGMNYSAFVHFTFSKLTIPSTLTEIKDGALAFTNNLTTIEVAPENPVLSSPDNNCLYDKTTNTLLRYSTADTVTFPEGTKHIGEAAFTYTKATSIEIPEGVQTIGISAFMSAYLKEVHIPSTMAYINIDAFGYSNLAKVTCDAMYPPTLGNNAFFNLPSDAVLYVPYKAIERYRDSGWSVFTTISAIPGSEDWENTQRLEVALTSAGTLSTVLPADYSNIRELVITGDINGDDIKLIRQITEESVSCLSVLDMKDARIVKGGSNEYKIEEDDVIPAYMLSGCRMGKWILPTSVKSVEREFLPSGLTSIDLPEGLKRIGEYAFCDNYLTSLTIPASVEEIGENAFFYSFVMTSLNVDPASTHYRSVDNIIYSADGKILVGSIIRYQSEIVVPDGVEKIYGSAFNDGSYQTITLPATVTYIGYNALSSYYLETINCLATTPPDMNPNVLHIGKESPVTVYVPEGSVEAYRSDPVWSKFNIVGVDFTGIDAITSGTEYNCNQRIYTISGMPVPACQALRHGLYIINGKKILVK